MTKNQALEWGAKLIESIAHLPEDAAVHGFELKLNLDAKPYNKMLSIQLSAPVAYPVITNGKRYSGWQEKRVWLKPDVYIWWSEDVDDGQ